MLAATIGAATVGGCGGTSSAPHAAREPWRTQLAASAIAACRHAVADVTSLSESVRDEIAKPCGWLDERVLENEETVRSVCQELASAASSAPNTTETKRIASDCYAVYAKTIPPAERLHSRAG